MKDTKYKILAYFDNQSYRKLFNEINSDYAENLQILLHNLSLFSYDVLIMGVILYKENISNIISAIRKITQIPIIILTDTSSLLCIPFLRLIEAREVRMNTSMPLWALPLTGCYR